YAVKLEQQKFCLFVTLQHIDFDGSALSVFIDELRDTYAALLQRAMPVLPPVTSYQSFARWQQDYIQSPEMLQDRAFFQGLYSMVSEVTRLPGYIQTAETVAHKSRRFTVQTKSGLWTRVNKQSRKTGLSGFSLLLAAY